MNERTMQFRVGVVVIVVCLLAGILILLFSDVRDVFRGTYEFHVRLPRAPGVTVDTPVRKSGILIGRVTGVQLLDEGGVIVTLGVYQDYRLRHNELPRIGGGTLLGDALIEFVPSPDPTASTQFIAAGETIQGLVAPSPLEIVGSLEEGLNQVVGSMTRASDNVSDLAQQVSSFMTRNEGQFTRLMAKSEKSLDSVTSMTDRLSELVQDPELRQALRKSLEDLPSLVREARAAMTSIQTTMASAETNLRNLQQFTEGVGQRGPQMMERADELFQKLGRSADKLDLLMENLVTLTDAINRRDGTVGRMLNDPQLYDNLLELTANINRLTIELRPVVRDAQVFADKIARHPELLGVRGALQGSDGVKRVTGGQTYYEQRPQFVWPTER
jgi:phospholipid/cholesterol/gamma-HCH transport system substrate-binding protein